jgi:deazaflavin-dependent oxidoreductase (nitroreductase family)
MSPERLPRDHLAMNQQVYDPIVRTALAVVTAVHRVLHRVTGGKVGRRFPGGGHVVWLTVTGCKSGRPRTVPLLGTQDGDGADQVWVITGSNGGQTRVPAWVHNVRANPIGQLEVDGERFGIRVEEVANEAERLRLYAALTNRWKGYTTYARRASRRIPVFRLHRVEQ